jgi:hypothetical protein
MTIHALVSDNVAAIAFSLAQAGRRHTLTDGREVAAIRQVGRHIQVRVAGAWLTANDQNLVVTARPAELVLESICICGEPRPCPHVDDVEVA